MTRNGRTVVIGWKVASLAFSLASVRYRALLPSLGLDECGFSSRIFSDSSHGQLDGLDLLVIVKGFGADDLALVQHAASRGLPVVLDLCDNIFIADYGRSSIKLKASPASMFVAMARLARCVVVTTEPLAQVVRSQLDGLALVHVIPDGLETRELVGKMRGRLSDAALGQKKSITRTNLLQRASQPMSRLLGHAKSLRTADLLPLTKRVARRAASEMHWKRWADRAHGRISQWRTVSSATTVQAQFVEPEATPRIVDPDAKRILWFGNHGEVYARFGMLDLLEIRAELETIATEFNVELVVVSNHREKYERDIKPLSIPSSYVDWSPGTIKRELSLASVVVVPNSRDAFSLCKSANRTATALLAGVPVVASRTPALDCLRDCVVQDDFLGGLRLYLGDSERAAADVVKGRLTIKRQFGQKAITAAWTGVIDQALRVQQPSASGTELVVALNLTQDIDIALPIIAAAKESGMAVSAYCNISLVNTSPRLIEILHREKIPASLLSENFDAKADFNLPPSVKILLTISESNLKPHQFTRKLTDIANKQDLFTATVQHGFENIGLTYDDEFHSADKVDFSARRIYIWGNMQTLHPKVRMATRLKCFPIGCPKPLRVQKADLDEKFKLFQTVVGIFENLHWTRYSEDYKVFFIENVQRLAHRFPEVLFLVKPHHAGLWLTRRFQGKAPTGENILIADPKSPEWEPYTAPSLMGHLQAIITSPSTVAVDAARQRLPVAVVAHKMPLANYEPLTLIRAEADWPAFLTAALHVASRSVLVDHGMQFISRTLLPDGAAERIVKDMAQIVPRALGQRA